MLRTKSRLISIVVPVCNEEANIRPLYTAVKAELNKLNEQYDYEFIFTDNQSTDSTFMRLSALAKEDPRVRVIRFSKNFGHQKSLLTGCCFAKGDCAILIGCDLEDPPVLIHEFMRKWEEGTDVVYGVRKSSDESRIIQFSRQFFYRLINYLSEDNLPLDASDFRLIDRKILSYLRKLRDANPYVRGTISKLGFRQVGIPYHRGKRLYGKSKFDLAKMMSLAIDGILNHSIVPLRLSTFIGLTISSMLIIYLSSLFFIKAFLRQQWPSGFATTSVLILVGISLNAIFLGVIGEYLGRIYLQMKFEPTVVIDEMINMDDLHVEEIPSVRSL